MGVYYISNGWTIDNTNSNTVASKIGAFFLAKVECNHPAKTALVTFKEIDREVADIKSFSMSMEDSKPIGVILSLAEEYIETTCVKNAIQIREHLRGYGYMCND